MEQNVPPRPPLYGRRYRDAREIEIVIAKLWCNDEIKEDKVRIGCLPPFLSRKTMTK
jgi:hypothetical protein